MMHIVYKCKKKDNELLIEKYYNFYDNKYETFVDYNNQKYNTEQNNCINKWIKNNNGMETYLNSLNDETRKIIINSITNIQCEKASKNTQVKENENNKPVTESKNQEEKDGTEEVQNNGEELTQKETETELRESVSEGEDLPEEEPMTKEGELSQDDEEIDVTKDVSKIEEEELNSDDDETEWG
jgi:hypothetical protein